MVKNLNSQESEVLKGCRVMQKSENITFREGSLLSLSVNTQNHFNWLSSRLAFPRLRLKSSLFSIFYFTKNRSLIYLITVTLPGYRIMAGPDGEEGGGVGNLFQENTSGRGMYSELARGQSLFSFSVSKQQGLKPYKSFFFPYILNYNSSLDQITSCPTQMTLISFT